MLPRTQVKPLMKKLAIKEEKNIAYFLKRLEGWINKNGNTTISLAKEIMELHNQGWGVRRIEKWLLEAHRARISHSSIYRFIKQQKTLTEA